MLHQGRHEAAHPHIQRRLGHGGHGLQGPPGAGLAALHPILQRAQVQVDVRLVDAPLRQALSGQGQQVIEDQGLGGVCLTVDPGELRLQAVAGRGVEVVLGVIELHHLVDVGVTLAEGHHQAEVEGGVAHLIAHRRPRGQDPVLDAQVGHLAVGPIAGPVPAPHRAGVGAQSLQAGDPAPSQDLERVLLPIGGEEDAEAGDVLFVDLQHRAADPVVAEAHPGRRAPGPLYLRAAVDGVLEQGHPRLVPQAAPHEQRGVHRRRQHRGRHGLGQVVELRELLGAHLEVDLEAGVRRLQHHVVVGDVQLVEALDDDVELAVVERGADPVQLRVAGRGGHGVEGEVGRPQGGQDAREHHPAPEAAGGAVGLLEHLVDLGLQGAQAAISEDLRREVGLQVVLGQLMREPGIVHPLQDVHGHRHGLAALVHQEHLLLRPDPPDPGLELALLNHLGHGL